MITVFVLYGGIMRKFNVDELIWFIILTLLSVSIIFLIKSGNITNFVGADMIKYFYVSIVILVLFAFIQFGRIFTIKRRMEITNKFIPLTFTLCIGVILFFLIPLLKNDDINNNLGLTKTEDTIVITNDNYKILNSINENKKEFEGKRLIFLGYIDKSEEYPDYIVVSRLAVSCCQADKEKISIRVKGVDENLENGQWISISGSICFDSGFYILSHEYKLQNEPKDIYYHNNL